MKGQVCHVVQEDRHGLLRRYPVARGQEDGVFSTTHRGFAIRVAGGWWRMKGQEARS